jgi:hypothetical protein
MSSTTPGSDPERRDGTPVDDDAVSETAPDETIGTSEAYDAPLAADEPVERVEPVEPVERGEPVERVEPVEPVASSEPVEPVAASEPVEPVAPADEDAPDAATARLDAAVERAKADAAASDDDGIDEAVDTPEPVHADAVRRETYVPAATVAAGSAAGAATLADEPAPLYVEPQPPQQAIYVQAPTPPRRKGNRGFGVLVSLVGTALFALLYAGVAYLLLLGQRDSGEANAVFTEFLTRPVFWVPIAVFFIGFALLAAIVNRGPYWAYAVFGLLVAVLVYFSYIGGALLTVEAWTLTTDQAADFIAQRWLDPFAIAAAVIAREVPVWLGGWIAARGRAVNERNRLAVEAYDRELAAGPQVQRY